MQSAAKKRHFAIELRGFGKKQNARPEPGVLPKTARACRDLERRASVRTRKGGSTLKNLRSSFRKSIWIFRPVR
jgi:hypothetical protein